MVVLLLLDGWGVAQASDANAITAASTPNFLNFIKEYPVALLNPGGLGWNVRYLSLGAGCDMADEKAGSEINLSAVISAAGLSQMKIAETERFAALTNFFNTHHEGKFPREEWKIVSSIGKNKETKPTLALKRAVKEIVGAINAETPPDFLAAVLPVLDLTAAGGDMDETKKAVTAADKALREIYSAVSQKEGVLIVTAAGGNAERMMDLATDLPDTGLTKNPVPFLIVGEEYKGRTIGLDEPFNNDLSSLAPAGTLADVAPTILNIMGLEKPASMSGESLI